MSAPLAAAWLRLRSRAAELPALLRLQIGGRWVFFLVADAVLLVGGLFRALLSDQGDTATTAYFTVVVAPALLLGVPALADLVALERDAGSLDLLLSVPDAARHLRGRALAVAAAMLGQAVVVLLGAWVATDRGFALLTAVAHAIAIFTLVAAAALYWATRLESAGGAGAATFASALALGPWFFAEPIGPRTSAGGNAWLPGEDLFLTVLGATVVLLAAAALFWLAARRRLTRTALLLR